MEVHQSQTHQEFGEQGSRHHLPGEEAEGRRAQVTPIPTPGVQREEGSKEKIDERAAQGEAEAEGVELDPSRKVRNHQEYQEY